MTDLFVRLIAFLSMLLVLTGCLNPRWYLIVNDGAAPIYFDLKEDKYQQIDQLLTHTPIDTGFYLSRKESKKMNSAFFKHKLLELSDAEMDSFLRAFQGAYLAFLQRNDSITKNTVEDYNFVGPKWLSPHRDTMSTLNESHKRINTPLPIEILPVFVVTKKPLSDKSDTLLYTYCCGRQFEIMISRKKFYILDRDFVLAIRDASLQ